MASGSPTVNKIEWAHQMYREGKYTEALGYYTDAISMAKAKPQKIAFHSNRVACHLILHDFKKALADPCFHGLANVEREPSTQPTSKLEFEFEFEFEFERRKLTKDDVRELIYREILEYHPQMLQGYLRGGDQTSGFMYPSACNCIGARDNSSRSSKGR